MEIREININEIKPYEKNAKLHDQKQIDGVAKSIEKFSFIQPLVIDQDGTIVIGHCRYLAAKKLKMKTVPCVQVETLTDEEIKALRLADNRLNESDWDLELLDAELDEILNIDMSDFGFDAIISPNEFGEEFKLPDGDKDEIERMAFILHKKQADLIRSAISEVKDEIKETFGNTNGNGNALYEVVSQWLELKK